MPSALNPEYEELHWSFLDKGLIETFGAVDLAEEVSVHQTHALVGRFWWFWVNRLLLATSSVD